MSERNHKTGRADLVAKIQVILNSSCVSPADEMIASGRALIAIGETLQDKSGPEQRAILQAVIALEGK